MFHDAVAIRTATLTTASPGQMRLPPPPGNSDIELQILKTRELVEQGKFDQALAEITALQEVSRGDEGSKHRGELLNLAGALHLATGSYVAANRAFMDATKVAHPTNNQMLLGKVLNNQAILQLQQNDARKALPLIEKALLDCERAGDAPCAAKIYVTYANALLDVGENDSAKAKIAIAHDKHLALPPSQSRSKGLAVIGDWYLQLAATVPEADKLITSGGGGDVNNACQGRSEISLTATGAGHLLG